MKALDPQKTGWVTFASWQQNTKEVGKLFKPVMENQMLLQKAYGGKAYWAKAAKTRVR